MSERFEAVIGLEVHLRLRTRTKLFCGCPLQDGRQGPNEHTCPVCLGLPGALPVPGEAAVRQAVRLALALGARVRPESRFARKHYVYPDLAKGYQISQHERPLAEGGSLALGDGPEAERVPIRRLHLEEDAAKNVHGGEAADVTLVDFDRAGAPLVELVTEPAIERAEAAETFLRRLRALAMFLGVNDGNLEDGSFRCDANVSLRPAGSAALGTRVELKNLNSFKFVRKALQFEIDRQRALLAGGGRIEQQTRAWDERSGRTVPMRGKEEAEDYRYVPDPDLPPLRVPEHVLREEAERAASERPEAVRARWQRQWGFRPQDAEVLSAHPALARYVDEVLDGLAERLPRAEPARLGRRVANFVQAEVLREVRTDGLSMRAPIPAGRLAELLEALETGLLGGPAAKRLWPMLREDRRPVRRIVQEEGLGTLQDEEALRAEVARVLGEHPTQLAQLRAGKRKVLGFFMGQLMRATGGRADPTLLRRLLEAAVAAGDPGEGEGAES